MTRQIAKQGYTLDTNVQGNFLVNAIFWLTSPANAATPNPLFFSSYFAIDPATLTACRNGTLTEQTYSQSFPLGTSETAVDSALVTAYASAQTTLNNLAANFPTLSTPIYDNGAWGVLGSGTLPMAPGQSLKNQAASLYASLSGQPHAAGNVQTSVANTQYPVLSTTYTPLTADSQISVASTNVNDTAAGTGARAVTIYYLDSTLSTLYSETIALNGTTPVNSVNTNYMYGEGAALALVGSSQRNLGTINFYPQPNGGGTPWGSIAIGQNMTFWAHHYVKAGSICQVLSAYASGTGAICVCNMTQQQGLATPGAPTVQIGIPFSHSLSGGVSGIVFDTPIAIAGPSRLVLYAMPYASTTNTTWGGFGYMDQ